MATEEIITFDGLMDLLERNPEHLARLRRVILDEEFQQLPAQVRAQSERFDALTEEVRALTNEVRLQVGRIDVLSDQMNLLIQTVHTHAGSLHSMAKSLEAHTSQLRRHENHLSRLIGDEAERRFQQNPAAYFGGMLRRVRVTDRFVLADLIDDAVDAGQLTEGDRRSLLALDLALQGLDRETRRPMRLAVEISSGIGERDIMRAMDRALLLGKLTGEPALAGVAGYSIAPSYRQLADDKGVAVTVIAPPDAGEPEEDDVPAAI